MRRLGLMVGIWAVAMFVAAEGAWACKYLDNLCGRCCARRCCVKRCTVSYVCCMPATCCKPVCCKPRRARAFMNV